jgi:hypothetical protein
MVSNALRHTFQPGPALFPAKFGLFPANSGRRFPAEYGFWLTSDGFAPSQVQLLLA